MSLVAPTAGQGVQMHVDSFGVRSNFERELFVYRSLGASYLAPARDIGIMAHGRFFKRGLNYWAVSDLAADELAEFGEKFEGAMRTSAAG